MTRWLDSESVATTPQPADDELVALAEKLLGQAMDAINEGMQFRLGIVSKEIRDIVPSLLKRITQDAERIKELDRERRELLATNVQLSPEWIERLSK